MPEAVTPSSLLRICARARPAPILCTIDLPRQHRAVARVVVVEDLALVVGEGLGIAAKRWLAGGGTKDRRRLEGGGHAARSTIVAGTGMLSL